MPIHRSTQRHVALTLALAVLPVFAIAGDLDSALLPAALADKTVAIISVTHEPESASWLECWIDGDDLIDRETLRSAGGLMRLGLREKSDFADRHGHLYVLELKPGHHKLFGWRVPSGNGAYEPSRPVPKLEFDVAKGDALYLGNIDAVLQLSHRTIFKTRATTGVDVSVQDRAPQDIPLAEKSHPGLAGRIRTALLTQGSWMPAAGVKSGDAVAEPDVPQKH
jgi:hypothetical protein